MATFLDLSLFNYFNVIFPLLLIFAVVFALLYKTNLLGKNLTLNALVAIVLALMSLVFPDLIKLISFIAPWFVVVFVFMIFLLLVYQLLGATEKDILGALKGDKTIQWAIFGISLVILFAGIAHVWGAKVLPATQQQTLETENSPEVSGKTSGTYTKNILATFFHPKILGLIFLFLIAIFTVAFLSSG